MKKSIFFILTLLCLSFAIQAQIKIGLRAGLSTHNLDRETFEQSGLKLTLKEAKYGYHLGFFARIPLSDIVYFQPEILFNSNTTDFEVDDFASELFNTILNEKYQYLDVPLLLGYKVGPFRLEAGVVGHVYLMDKTELDQIDNYKQRFKNLTFGYQTGLGLDIWKLLIDLRYEGNFNDFGEHMHIGEQQIDFSQGLTRWVMTVGFSF